MIKHVLRYLVGSINIGVEFSKSSDPGAILNGWADADYGTSLVSKKSMSGYVICFYGNPISWTTKKQPVVRPATRVFGWPLLSYRPSEPVFFG
jgi:hypothetical protein